MKNVFCSRKGGVTHGDKFTPLRTSDIMALALERQTDKMVERIIKRERRKSR